MNHRSAPFNTVLVIALLCMLLPCVGYCQDMAAPSPGLSAGPGDRITTSLAQPAGLAVTSLSKDTYRLGPGDVLSVNFQSRSTNTYPSTTAAVMPTGGVYLSLIGNVEVLGKTVLEVESEIRERLTQYFKHFTLDVQLASPRAMYVWAFGEVSHVGLHPLPAVATASVSALSAGVQPSGSVRRIEFVRDDKKMILDLYRVMVLGEIESDFDLQPGDKMYVPLVTRTVSVRGEVRRAGRYEMVTLSGDSETFRVRDLLELAIGTTPAAALDKASLERIGPDQELISVKLDLRDQANSPAADVVLQPDDALVIPSIAAFQPMIRMVGEFKGDGVYQRLAGGDNVSGGGGSEAAVESKTGIYSLKEGQTVWDVIVATGGVTPQADLRRARVQREEDGKICSIPVDLERLLLRKDKSADVALMSGDWLILPALQDKVYIFGEVNSPGSHVYSPSRRLIDYIGDAGGPTQMAKLTQVSVVRGTAESPKLFRFDAKRAMRGVSAKDNPELEPGDVVYVPSKIISGWRDAIQLIFTGLSLSSLLGN